LKRIGSKAIADAESKTRAKIESVKVRKMAEYQAIFNDREKALEASLGDYGKWIADDKGILDGKLDGLVKEIDRRKKGEENKLKEKARGALEGILK